MPRRVCCRFALPSDLTLGNLPRAVRHARTQRVRQPSEGPLLAASRTASKPTNSPAKNGTSSTAPRRISFAKIREPLEVPNLLALQTDSFDTLLGNEKWRARVEQAQKDGRDDVPTSSGLEEIFEEISPIEDFQGTMSLSFRDHRFEPPKYSIEDCKERDITYSAPLFVTAEFMNNTTGEIKSQTVFMGDFPLMTDKGTFVINGTERVVVSQLVRSPGVYFDKSVDKTSDKDVFGPRSSRPAAPGSSSRSTSATRSASASTASASSRSRSCSRPSAGTTPRSSRSSATTSRSGPPWRRTTPPARTTRCSTSTASCARASRRPARRRRRCWTTSTSTRSATTWPRSAATRSTRSSGWTCRCAPACSPSTTSSRPSGSS